VVFRSTRLSIALMVLPLVDLSDRAFCRCGDR
jgi:hypothetical protein